MTGIIGAACSPDGVMGNREVFRLYATIDGRRVLIRAVREAIEGVVTRYASFETKCRFSASPPSFRIETAGGPPRPAVLWCSPDSGDGHGV